MSIEEYTDLATTGFQGGGNEQIAPEDELFHSLYISVSDRVNHINIKEETGKLQIRGVQYNLDEVYMIITHTKDILANIIRDNKTQKDNTICFSYKEGSPPWYGTSKLSDGSNRQCPQTSTDRAVNDFCNTCKAQIIVAGIQCLPDGKPLLTTDKKPKFIFIRGKGMKYSNVSEYLNDLYKEDSLAPLFQPVTPQSTEFEKAVVNNKRFVTKITRGQEKTSFGNMANIFVLSRGIQIPNDDVMKILKISKSSIDKFNEKFDWSKNKKVTNYGQTTQQGILPVENEKPQQQQTESNKQNEKVEDKIFSFDDINF